MLENIINIGKTLKDNGEEKTIPELWIRNTKPKDSVLVIDLTDGILKFDVKDFEESVYVDSLFYNQGNSFKNGSGISVDSPKKLFEEISKGVSKELEGLEKRLHYSLKFLEIDEKKFFNEYKRIIMNEISKNKNESYFIMFTKETKTPLELYGDKFETEIKKSWKTDDKLSKSVTSTVCQNCGKKGKGYDTAIFKFYNNDKGTYSNIYNDIGKDVFSYSLCEDCIKLLLNGKQYISDNMTTKWLGTNVMFIPHELTPKIRKIYEDSFSQKSISSNNEYIQDNFIKGLYRRERVVFEELATVDSITDIVFFEEEKNSFKIKYSIQGVLPSMFGRLGEVLSKYEQVLNHNDNIEFLYLKDVFKYSLMVAKGDKRDNKEFKGGKKEEKDKKISTKDRIDLMNAFIEGEPWDKRMFYRSALKEYERVFIESVKNNTPYLRPIAMRRINKIYNIFVELGCFDKPLKIIDRINEGNGGRYKMIQYKNREEFFEQNSEFFDSNMKKAWFILGELYSKAIYESKEYYKVEGEDKKNQISHLEDAYNFSQKFDRFMFYELSNKCQDQFNKYKKIHTYSLLFNKMKDLMAKDTKDIYEYEAKFIFFWGMESFFSDYTKKKESEDGSNNNEEGNKNEDMEEEVNE